MFTYHIDAFYNFTSGEWFQKAGKETVPTSIWYNLTWKTPQYPAITDTIIATGK